MLLDTDTAQVVTLAAAGVSVLAVGFSAACLLRIRKLTAAQRREDAARNAPRDKGR